MAAASGVRGLCRINATQHVAIVAKAQRCCKDDNAVRGNRLVAGECAGSAWKVDGGDPHFVAQALSVTLLKAED